jgi:hypothetical protein
MDNQNVKVIYKDGQCEVNIFDYFFNSFKQETNALTKHLCLKK